MKYNADCEKCVHAKVGASGVFMLNGKMIIQSSGGTNIVCQEKVIRTLRMTDEGMYCSSFEEKQS